MIDPITAFAAAQTAVAGIKKAIALGKDIQGLVGDFQKFFDAKDTIIKAVNDNAKAGRSDTSVAMEMVMHQHAVVEAERDLKEMLIYGGYPHLWEQMLIQRNKLQQDRKAAELAAIAARKKRRADIANAAFLSSMIVCSIVVMGCIVYFLVLFSTF